MIIPLNVELHVSDRITPEDRAAAVAHAQDSDALGIDAYVAETITTDSPFPDVLAHLLMFDPAWLFRRPWLMGWTAMDAEPVNAQPTAATSEV